MTEMTIQYTPIRNLNAEPVYIRCEGDRTGITSVRCDGMIFPASPYKEGIIAILTGEKGVEMTLTAGCDSIAPVEIAENPAEHRISVSVGGAHFSDYVYDPAICKPYFGQITDDAGNPFTRLDLTTKEHVHQRSLIIAIGDVNGVDCWNEPADCGLIRNESVTDVVSSAAYGSFTANNRWTDHDGNPLMKESTKYTVYNQTDECRALDVEITFTADSGDVVFGPTKEAGPLGIRLIDGLREDIGTGTLSNSWGGVGEKECWSRSAAWCDYVGSPEGVGVMGVTVFDNEKNERFPTAWHIRSYGLFAANNLYFKGGYTLKSGESITYRYRILFRRREMTRDELADRFVLYTMNPKM